MTSTSSLSQVKLHGIAAAPGQVVAPAWRWAESRVHASGTDLTGETGINRLQIAIRDVKAALATKATGLEASGAAAEAGILQAQALMLDDPALLDGASSSTGHPA
ncbi:MAG: hypothetical protein E6I46_04290 [Chloroflexi bacterium]|nr:MAG: hypothetical protein E6I46_04290 [Chloroflexota bacterium]